MIVKNLERIQRMIVQLEAILETDSHLDAANSHRIKNALFWLKEIDERFVVERDDTDTIEGYPA